MSRANLCQQRGNNAKRNPKCTQLRMKYELLKSATINDQLIYNHLTVLIYPPGQYPNGLDICNITEWQRDNTVRNSDVTTLFLNKTS